MNHFLAFHTLVELLCIGVSFAAFLVVWSARKRMDSGLLLLIAIAYVFVAILDLAHMLTYDGVGAFGDVGPNLPTQFWVAARGLQAVSWLVAPFYARRPLAARPALALYALVTLGLMITILKPWPGIPAFPDCYVAGQPEPLTRFKVLAEFVISGVMVLALLLVVLVRHALDRMLMLFLVWSLGLTALSQMLFATYADAYGSVNVMGHLMKALAFYLVYRAIIDAGLIRPFEVLFRSAAQSRRQVQESEERFRTLSAATFEGIAITENGRIVDVNEQLLGMLGSTREDMLGEPISVFLEPEDRDRVLENIREGLEGSLDYRLIRKDGSFLHAETHGKMVRFMNRTVRVIAIRDITERKRAEAGLLEARNTALKAVRELARSNRDLEQFAHVASHDLKEPLRMVNGFLDLLRDQYGDRLDERARGYVQFVVNASHRLMRLIDDLLEYARIGTDSSTESFPLEEAVATARDHLALAFRDSGASLRVDPLPPVKANRLDMVLLFQNLLGNAITYRSAAPPAVLVGASPRDAEWEFFVRDNGTGIDPAYQNRLFQIFQRLQPADDYPGSGVGLAICKKIVERYGGTIRVDSEPGKGSTFWFTLPDARAG